LTCEEPLGHFALDYPRRKRERYEKAVADVLQDGLTRRDAGVTMFIKCEKMNPVKINPDPRAIQFRDPKYCVVLASYLKPIERYLYALRLPGITATGSRVVGKGMNQVERASALLKKVSAFCCAVILSLI